MDLHMSTYLMTPIFDRINLKLPDTTDRNE